MKGNESISDRKESQELHGEDARVSGADQAAVAMCEVDEGRESRGRRRDEPQCSALQGDCQEGREERREGERVGLSRSSSLRRRDRSMDRRGEENLKGRRLSPPPVINTLIRLY